MPPLLAPLSHKTAFEIRDLDECATREEICVALSHQLGVAKPDPDVVRSLRKAYAGTQTAVIDLPDELAAKAIRLGHLRVWLGGFNAWSTEWGSSETKTSRGVILLDALSALDVVLLNTGRTPTFITGPQGSSTIDLSLCQRLAQSQSGGVARGEEYFQPAATNQRAITFKLSVHRPPGIPAGPRCGWSARTLDEETFSERLSGVRIPHTTPEHPEDMAASLISAITGACSASMSSRGGRHRRRHEPVYWWTEEIAALRRQCLRARRLAQRARGRAHGRTLVTLILPSREADYALHIEDSKRRLLECPLRRGRPVRVGPPIRNGHSAPEGSQGDTPRARAITGATDGCAALFPPTVTEAADPPSCLDLSGPLSPGVTLDDFRPGFLLQCTRRAGAACTSHRPME
ncbi:unnamed protein product [Trichogramma brassicae]|uniref:Endonuclease/exonuclease/phosphatase domain-containing protein n=1 Tax=Trichogramma brassicae TaxID=86971 RepID=A0A6H5ITX7_9HYME|nr:unnamed protein product [Trichogramma brassicae]